MKPAKRMEHRDQAEVVLDRHRRLRPEEIAVRFVAQARSMSRASWRT
jgi:hypothetical protein